MKINRASEEMLTPDWAFSKETKEFFTKETVNSEELNRLANLSSDISDEDIVSEKEKIEICASSKTPYHYNTNWNNDVKSELKEYASVCGLDETKFKAINPSKIVASTETKMVKTASVEAPKLVIDAFKIDEKIANGYQKGKWEQEVKKAEKLNQKPSMTGIVPVRGGEDYFTNSESKVAKGQNSITDPDAIGKLAKSLEEDTGARLRKENKIKEEARKVNHANWQTDKIEAMDKKDILQTRRVFPTECLNAQPGIRGEVFDFTSVPEKTVGEGIKSANEKYRKSIKGDTKAKHEFDVAKNPTREISDVFSGELAKFLKK